MLGLLMNELTDKERILGFSIHISYARREIDARMRSFRHI